MMNDFEKAIFAYSNALKLNPDSAECHFNIASAYNDKGDLQNALLHYQQSLKHDPSNPETLINLGTILETQKLYKDAIEAFKAAMKLQPDSAKAKEGIERNQKLSEYLAP